MDRSSQSLSAQIERLRQLAAKATPGHREVHEHDDNFPCILIDRYPDMVGAEERLEHAPGEHFWYLMGFRPDLNGPNDAAYEAALDPATVTRLCDAAALMLRMRDWFERKSRDPEAASAMEAVKLLAESRRLAE